MSRPIQPTPILRGKDAERLIADVEAVNKKLENPVYRRKIEAELDRCMNLYLRFSRKGKQIGDCSCFENSLTS